MKKNTLDDRDNVDLYMFTEEQEKALISEWSANLDEEEKLNCKEYDELEDIFLTEEFQALPCKTRLWIRLKVALVNTLQTL